MRLTPWKVRALCALCVVLAAGERTLSAADFAFSHPGLLHSRADLARMKENVAARQLSTYSDFQILAEQVQSRSNYVLRGPLPAVGRNPGRELEYDSDANAAYQNALMWAITGEKPYAEKSKEIINKWSATLKTIGGRDAVLMAGLGPFKMVNAAEILRYTDAGWAEEDVKAAEQHFREVLYPVLKDFALYANGNWDTAAIKTVLAIAVFLNDREMFERALRYYVNGGGDGTIWHYIINDAGQCQESGRDNAHAQLGLAHMGDACEIAWQQGLDLYGYADNRLLKGFEYLSKYNLGENVPFVETLDRTGKYHHTEISPIERGRFRSIFEQIYNHYVNRAGIPAPYTQRVAAGIRPEGPHVPGADHPGFGTLLFTRPAGKPESPRIPASPGGVLAAGQEKGIKLTWIPPFGATTYTVSRATSPDGPFAVIEKDVKAPTCLDETVEPAKVYYYRVAAANAGAEQSPESLAVGACLGLPSPWKSQDIGAVQVAGSTAFDGSMFTLDAAGRDIGVEAQAARAGGTVSDQAGRGNLVAGDQCQFAYVPMTGTGTVIARFVPQMSSQVSKFGLMMRATLAVESPMAALLIVPSNVRNIETPGYRAVLMTRDLGVGSSAGPVQPGRGVSSVGIELPAPMVTYGRLLGPCWLRLTRDEGVIRASMSDDGVIWMEVATVRMRLPADLLVGLCACSCLTTVQTRVRFDHVSVGPMTSTTRP